MWVIVIVFIYKQMHIFDHWYIDKINFSILFCLFRIFTLSIIKKLKGKTYFQGKFLYWWGGGWGRDRGRGKAEAKAEKEVEKEAKAETEAEAEAEKEA